MRPWAAAQVPDARDSIVNCWEEEHYSLMVRDNKESLQHVRGLLHSGLYWVGDEMVDLLVATIPQVPLETVPEDLIIPEQAGFVVLAHTWETASDARSTDPLKVDAFAWAISAVSKDLIPCLSVDYYVNSQTITKEKMPLGHDWYPLGRSDWPYGKQIDDMSHFSEDDPLPLNPASITEDRQMISALFSLLAAEYVTETIIEKPSRQIQRQRERKGKPPVPGVKVIYLRRPKNQSNSSNESGRHFNHRFLVRSHPRLQPYGPGRSQRKLIMVPAHIRGPRDAPFIPKEEVKAWIR